MGFCPEGAAYNSHGKRSATLKIGDLQEPEKSGFFKNA
jgi:hypothetical protein